MKQSRRLLQSAISVSGSLSLSMTQFHAHRALALIALLLPRLATAALGGETVTAPACAQMPTGVVSCWRAEGNALDSAGNNNGVMIGNATYGLGLVGRSFVFDGDRDGVMVGTGTNLQLQNFTIEAWIKRTSATTASFNGNSNAQLFVVGTDPGGLSFVLRQSDNCLMLNKSGGASLISDAKINDTLWHHIAVAKEETRIVFYVDGEPFPRYLFDPGTFTFSAPACVGGWFNRTGQMDNSFYGSIDELAIYDRALVIGEIASVYRAGEFGKCRITNQPPTCLNPPTGLLSWWRAENDAFDSIGANHGTLTRGTGYDVGKVTNGFALHACGNGVCVGAAQDLRLQDFSIEAWIKRASSSVTSSCGAGVAEIFSLGSSGSGFGFYLRPDGLLAFGKMLVNEVHSNASVTDTNWHHVVLTKTGTTVVFYLDAVAHPAPPYDSGGFTFDGPGYIGARLNLFNQVDNNFYGIIDEVGFYNRAVNATEVLSQFNAGSAGKCPSPTPPSIVAQPRGQTVVEGDEVIQMVTVTGSPPLSYQWRRDGRNIPGATSSSFVLPSAQLVDTGVYTLSATNLYGSATSSNIMLTVNPLPDCAPVCQNLMGWWCGESNVIDSVAGNNGSLLNGAGFSSGKVGLAFSFNGNNQSARMSNSFFLNPTNALTLECWVYVEQYSTNDGVVIAGKDDPVATKHQYVLGISNAGGKWVLGTLVGVPSGVTFLQGVTPLTLQTWHHVAMTYDGSVLRLYVNGILDGSLTASGPIVPATHPFFIGGYASGPWSFNGRVDELSLYHRALTPAEIRSIYLAAGAGKCSLSKPETPLPPGLIGWWPAESNVVDSISRISSVAVNGTSYAPGMVGSAFCFNGENQLVRVTNAASLNPPNGFTLECWVNVEKFSTNHWTAIAVRNDSLTTRRQFLLGLANIDGKWVFRALLGRPDREAMAEGTRAICAQTWYHVAVTYDGGGLRLYLNAVLEGDVAASGPITTAALPLLMGGDDTGASSFNGRLDEVSLYDRALTSQEIASHCLAGKAGKSLTDPRPSVRDLRKWLFGGKQESPDKSKGF